MKANQLVPLTFAAGAMITLAVTGVGNGESFQAKAGHDTVTPSPPPTSMMMGQTVGEVPNLVTTTTTVNQPAR